MTVNDLLKVLSEKTGRSCEFYLSRWLSVKEVSENLILLELDEDTPQNRNRFKTPIKSGYWVYSYLTCGDELCFERFDTKEDAERYYNSILLVQEDSDSLVVVKMLLEVGV